MKRFFALLILILTLFSFTAITSFASEIPKIPDFHFTRNELNKCISDSGLSLEKYDVGKSKFWIYRVFRHEVPTKFDLAIYYADNDFKISSRNDENFLYNSDGSPGVYIYFNLCNGKLTSCRLGSDNTILSSNIFNYCTGWISPFDLEKHSMNPDTILYNFVVSNPEKYIDISIQLFDVVPQNSFTDLLLRLKPLVLPVFIAVIGFLSFRKSWDFIISAVKGA